MGSEARAKRLTRDALENHAARFWSKITKTDGCWLWTAKASHAFGYGSIKISGRQLGAHRVAYALSFGEAPAGLAVLHKCDNPLCCRPDHLFLGTSIDNNVDRTAKGRSESTRGYPGLAGDKNASAKLNWDQVRLIREGRRQGQHLRALAQRFNISKSMVDLIVRHQAWQEASHVQG